MNLSTTIKSLIVAMTLAMASSAQALVIDFSFTDDGSGDPGHIAGGVVTGQIFGLIDNWTSGATDIVVTSYTTGVLGLPEMPFSVFSWKPLPWTTIEINSFTVVNGEITSGSFGLGGGYFDLNVGPYGGKYYNALVSPDQQTRIQNASDAPSTIFGSVPEPASLALLGIGLLGLGFSRRKKA